ncbi:MAG: SGNH/GDSL hydrolase family protein [Phaeospirillum sp.]|nr:SGNH/GDSL hydrolase family protein [Phaeospirillum sp.]
MKQLRSFFIYALICLITVGSVEAGSFAYLCWRTKVAAGTTWTEASRLLLLRHPSQHRRHAYGGFDPIGTQFLRAHTTYADLRTNSWGFVANGDDAGDPPVFPDKGKGNKMRIILLGGSSMVGAGASRNSQTIAAHLERLLTADGIKAEVFNYGMFGAHSHNELLRIVNEVVFLQANLVIVLNGWNDAIYTIEHLRQGLPHPIVNWSQLSYSNFDYFHGLSEFTRVPPPVMTYTWLLIDTLTSAPTATGGDARKVATYNGLPFYHLSETLLGQAKAHGMIFGNNVGAMAAICASQGIGFAHYLQPHPEQFKPLSPEEEEKIVADLELYEKQWGLGWRRAVFRQHQTEIFDQYADAQAMLHQTYAANPSVRFTDLRPLFADVRERIYMDVIHYNDTGNRLLARRFADDIKASLGQGERK